MIKSTVPSDKTSLIFCNSCNRKTNHVCKMHEYYSTQSMSDEEIIELARENDPAFNLKDGIRNFEVEGYRLWACAGCDTWTIEIYETMIPEGDEIYLSDLEPDTDSRFIPERTLFHVRIKQFHQLPTKLNRIYREVLHSYNNNLPVLCAVGIRALVEGICADQEIWGHSLKERIQGLSSVLPNNIVDNLHSLRFMGNEAAHELVPPEQDELHLAIELSEDLLNFLYELNYRATSLAKKRKTKRAKDNQDQDISDFPAHGSV